MNFTSFLYKYGTAAAFLAAVLTVAIIFAWLRGFSLPPVLMMPVIVNKSAVEQRLESLDRLEMQTSIATEASQVQSRRKSVIRLLDGLTPEDISDLAIQAEKRDPWLVHRSAYHDVFYVAISRLGCENSHAKLALWLVKQHLAEEGHLDGHLAESIAEAESKH